MSLIHAGLFSGNQEHRAVLLHRLCDFLFVLGLCCVSALCSVQVVVALLHVFPDHRVSVVKNKQKQIQA